MEIGSLIFRHNTSPYATAHHTTTPHNTTQHNIPFLTNQFPRKPMTPEQTNTPATPATHATIDLRYKLTLEAVQIRNRIAEIEIELAFLAIDKAALNAVTYTPATE